MLRLRYRLSPHAYVCVADNHAVFLDLKQDRYTALAPRDAETLESVVEAWPIARSGTSSSSDKAGLELAEELAKQGLLLTGDNAVGRPAVPVNLKVPIRALGSLAGPFPDVTWQDLRRFTVAWARVTTALRCLPLRLVVERIRRRKTLRRSAEVIDLQRMRRLMMAYFVLQPNFFSGVDACLRNSLTFTEFLASYDLYPTWVFGVRMNPFRAHSWVQEGDLVLNDRVERVRPFTPIMTI